MKKAVTIPWWDIEERYAALFPSDTGMPAKPLQTALGSLMIQKKYDYSDRELVEQIRENPYYQYFIGLPGYQDEHNYYKPRMYRQNARKDYLNLAKCKKRSAKKIRKAIKSNCSIFAGI